MEVKHTAQDYYFFLNRDNQHATPLGKKTSTTDGELDETKRPLVLETQVTDYEGNPLNKKATLTVCRETINPTVEILADSIHVTIGKRQYNKLDIFNKYHLPIPDSDGKIRIIYS